MNQPLGLKGLNKRSFEMGKGIIKITTDHEVREKNQPNDHKQKSLK
jgi:hypothetical protein